MGDINFASVEFSLDWDSADARHRERQFLPRLDCQRDGLPGELGRQLSQAEPGGTVRACFGPGELVPAYQSDGLRDIPAAGFEQGHRI